MQYVTKDEIQEALENAKRLPPSMVEEEINLEPVVQKIKEMMK